MEVSEKINADLSRRRQAAAVRLWWWAFQSGFWLAVFSALLVIDLALTLTLMLEAAHASHSLGNLVNRLMGDAAEAAWLGWGTYFGWILFSRARMALRDRRRFVIARKLLLLGHYHRWFLVI